MINLRVLWLFLGPAAYHTGGDKTTLISGRRSAPAYSMAPKSKHGHFCEDMAKVCADRLFAIFSSCLSVHFVMGSVLNSKV